MPACKSWMKYSWEVIYCDEPPWEHDPEGLCILHSLKPDKDKNAFEQAVRNKMAREEYNFREIYFPGPASLTKQRFKKPVNFYGVKFAGWADFREAEFADEVDFSYARFSQAALFEKARFEGQCLFKGAEIAGEADFCGAFFSAPAIFQQINETRGGSKERPSLAFFQYLNFGPKGSLCF